MPAIDPDLFRIEIPNLTIAELQDRIRASMDEFVSHLKVDVSAYRDWLDEIVPQIASYVALSTVDPVKAKNELDILYAIAKVKAAKLALVQTANGESEFGNYAVIVARTLVKIFM